MKNLVKVLSLKFWLYSIASFIILTGIAFPQTKNKISAYLDSWKRKVKVFTRFYQDTKDDNCYEDTQAIDARLKIDNRIELKNWDAFLNFGLEGHYETFIGNNTEKDLDLLLGEAYLELPRENYSFSLGRQIVTWGKLDDVFIIDRINPQDYKMFILQDKQDRKMPVFMLKHEYYGNNYQLESLFLPFFKPSRVNFFGSDWAMFGHLKEIIAGENYSAAQKSTVQNIEIREKDKFTENTLKNSQIGMRFRSRMRDIDYSLCYMYIYNRIPTLREKTPNGKTVKNFLYQPTINNLNELAALNPTHEDLTLEEEYGRTHVLGGDFETVMGKFGIRGELGLFLDMPYLRRDFSYVRKDTFSLGLGVDYTMENNLYCNFQVIEDMIFNYEDLFAQEEYSHQVMNTLTKDFLRGNLTLNLDSAYSISYHDWMLNPELTYNFNNGFELGLGGFIFEGSPTSLFGRYSTKDLVYLETKYQF